MAAYRFHTQLDDSDSTLSESSSESDDEGSSDDSDELQGATYNPKPRSQVSTTFQIGCTTVAIVGGDLSRQNVDVIVNSTNPNLDLSQGRSSSSLLSAAGRGIQRECQQKYPNGVRPGQIAVTTGGNLACAAIYHGVLTRYSSKKEEQILADLVTVCLDQADSNRHRSIAFPPFGTGYLSYPSTRVAEIMLECIEKYIPRTVTSVNIVIYSIDSSCFQDFLNAAMKHSSSTSLQSHRQHNPSKVSGSSGSSVRIGSVNVRVVLGALNTEKVSVRMRGTFGDVEFGHQNLPDDLQLHTGALSRVLLKDAGPGLQQELSSAAAGGINYGGLVITKGYGLPCKFVFHGALPKWGSLSPNPSGCLDQFVTKCLESASFNSLGSIAFPTLGIGALGYPTKDAIKVIVQSIHTFSFKQHCSMKEIIIVVYNGNKDSSKVHSELLKALGLGQNPSGSQGTQGGASSGTQGGVSSGTQGGASSGVKFSRNIGNIPVNVIIGSLPDQNVGVLVNSIGQDIQMNSGVSSALASAAGPNLINELQQKCPSRIPYGTIAVTKGYNLKCAEVFHGALLQWYSKSTGTANQPDIVLEEFVYKCLKTANAHGHKSIAFPALGTGNLKFPLDVAVACIVAAIVKFSAKYSFSEIRIVLYGGSPDLRQLEKEFKDELANPGKKVSAVGHPVPHGQSSQYKEPPRGTKAWLAWKYREDLRTPMYWTKYTNKKTLKDWNLDVKPKVHSLEPVDQRVFNSISAALKSSMSGSKIISIKRIENVDVYQKYGDECQRLFRKANVEGDFVPLDKVNNSKGPVKLMKTLDPAITKYTHSEINEFYFFHGTKAQCVDVICSQGLDSRLAASGRVGCGVYGAEVASKSHQYVGPNHKGENPMFLIRMCLGDVFLTNSGGNFKRPPCKKCPNIVCTTHLETYDSVVANGGSFSDREFVVYDRNQSYPEYLIWYT